MEIERNAKTRFSWSDVFEADVSFIVRLISIIIAVKPSPVCRGRLALSLLLADGEHLGTPSCTCRFSGTQCPRPARSWR